MKHCPQCYTQGTCDGLGVCTRNMDHRSTLAELSRMRTALEEHVPREPTEAMQQAGLNAMFDMNGDLKRSELFLLVRKGWRAMYDAAIAERALTAGSDK